jgi:hypothetical protein
MERRASVAGVGLSLLMLCGAVASTGCFIDDVGDAVESVGDEVQDATEEIDDAVDPTPDQK